MNALEFNDRRKTVINLAGGHPVSVLESLSARTARIEWHPEQAGDMPHTAGDISRAKSWLNYRPRTDFRSGVESFLRWMDAPTEALKAQRSG